MARESSTAVGAGRPGPTAVNSLRPTAKAVPPCGAGPTHERTLDVVPLKRPKTTWYSSGPGTGETHLAIGITILPSVRNRNPA